MTEHPPPSGLPQQPPLPYARDTSPYAPQETSQTALWAMISGILAVVLLPPVGVLSIVLASRAHREIGLSRGTVGGTGVATAGTVLGWIGVALTVLYVVVVLMVVVLFGASLAIFS